MSHRFIITDVFTDQPFGGNQLGVFPDAEGIPDALMQAYARELNFSETTFVLPPRKAGHTHRVRIFTPAKELPFAGHPNIGTAVVLASLGGAAEFVFDEDVGTVRVSASVAASSGGSIGSAELRLERGAEFQAEALPADGLAAMLSLQATQVGPLPPWSMSVGLPFLCVPLRDIEAVAEARFDLGVWEQVLPPGSRSRDVYAVAGDYAPGGRLKVRMWGPEAGVPEDPATGSAAAALAATLAARLPDPEGVFGWSIEQGAEIGRSSLIEAFAEKHDGRVIAIRVRGQAVIVAEGSFR